jgi:hypothetical protein
MSTAPRRPVPWVYVAIAAPAVVALTVLILVLARPGHRPAPPPQGTASQPVHRSTFHLRPTPPPSANLGRPAARPGTQTEPLPLSRRQAIFRAWVAAEDRATHEANQRYPRAAQWRDRLDAETAARERYRGRVLTDAGLTRSQMDQIRQEAFRDHWPIPPYPATTP